jgi:hypothetical protein
VTTRRKLNTLLFELQTAGSPLQQARILVRGWRTLRELSPTDRRLLANHAGFDGAEEILEGLAKRRGGIAPAMLLRVLANARSTDGATVSGLLSAVRDPLRRDEAIRLGTHLAAELLAEDDSESAAEDDVEEIDEALSELQTVKSAIEDSPEEALAALSALDEDEEEDAVDAVPVPVPVPEFPAAPVPEQQPPPEPEIAPSPPAPPIVDWSRWQTTSPTHRTPALTYRPGPTPRMEMAPPADDPESRRFDAQVVFGALGAEPSVLSRLRVLRRELSGFAGSSVETLRELVESFEDGWSRRRALAALLEEGIPESAGDALELVAVLERELDRRWCLGILARRGDLQGSRLDRALELVSSPSARRRIETAARS